MPPLKPPPSALGRWLFRLLGKAPGAAEAAGKTKKPLKERILGSLEGYYARNPKHMVPHDIVPGIKSQTIPQVVRSYGKAPGSSLKKSWTAMGGSAKGPISGVHIPAGKTLPRLQRSGETPKWYYPSLERVLFTGSMAGEAANAARSKGKARGEALGRALGGSGAWLMSSRMRLGPQMLTFLAGDYAGKKIGKGFSSALSKKKAS